MNITPQALAIEKSQKCCELVAQTWQSLSAEILKRFAGNHSEAA